MNKRTTCHYGTLPHCTNTATDAYCRHCTERLTGGIVGRLCPALIDDSDRADKRVACQDDASRAHASDLAEVLAKRL